VYLHNRCILATDLARHNEITTNFRAIAPIFDYTNKDHRQMVCLPLKISLTCCYTLDNQLYIICDQCAADVNRYQSGRCVKRVSPNERGRAMAGVSAGGVLCAGV
jgi:hypothetical protein